MTFLPNTAANNGDTAETTILDQSQAYILSTDSRLFNTYVRTGHDSDHVEGSTTNYGEHIITTEMEVHQHQNVFHKTDYTSVDTNAKYIAEIDGIVNPNTHPTSTEIILQDSNGQFYRQIQNVYVDECHTDTSTHTTAVELLPETDHLVTYEDHVTYHHQDYGMPAGKHEHGQNTEMVLVPNVPNVGEHVEVLVHNAYSLQHDYATVMDVPIHRNIQKQTIQSHELGACQLQGTSTMKIEPVHTQQQLSVIEKEHQRMLLESTMSPLCKLFYLNIHCILIIFM